jgi:hypothetical protein
VQCSLWYEAPNELWAGGLVTEEPQAALHSLMLLMMAKLLPETCRATLDLPINRYCCIWLVFFFTIDKNVPIPNQIRFRIVKLYFKSWHTQRMSSVQFAGRPICDL